MKEYRVNYRARGDKAAEVFETITTNRNLAEARRAAREDIESGYVIVSVKLAR